MTNQIMQLDEIQLETIAGGHPCLGHHHYEGHGLYTGILGQLERTLASFKKGLSNTNISIIIIANSTINGTLGISVNQSI